MAPPSNGQGKKPGTNFSKQFRASLMREGMGQPFQPSVAQAVPTIPPHDQSGRLWALQCLHSLHQRTRQVLAYAGPELQSDMFRRAVTEFVCTVLSNTFDAAPQSWERFRADTWPENVFVASSGSFPLKTYLVGGDIDLVAFVPSLTPQKFILMVEQRFEALKSQQPPFPIKSILAITDSAVPVAKLVVGDVRVDVSVNQPHGPLTALFFERCDRALATPACPHLFKETVILAKAWAANEAHVLGSHHHQLSSFAITTIVLHVFVRFPSIQAPLQGFALFIEFLASYLSGQHLTHAIAVPNLVPIKALGTTPAETALLAAGVIPSYISSPVRIAMDDVAQPLDECYFQVRPMNILDPLSPSNNVARAVSALTLSRLARASQFAAQQMRLSLVPAVAGRAVSLPNILAHLDMLFINTIQRGVERSSPTDRPASENTGRQRPRPVSAQLPDNLARMPRPRSNSQARPSVLTGVLPEIEEGAHQAVSYMQDRRTQSGYFMLDHGTNEPTSPVSGSQGGSPRGTPTRLSNITSTTLPISPDLGARAHQRWSESVAFSLPPPSVG